LLIGSAKEIEALFALFFTQILTVQGTGDNEWFFEVRLDLGVLTLGLCSCFFHFVHVQKFQSAKTIHPPCQSLAPASTTPALQHRRGQSKSSQSIIFF
jgi:hypothetical protein